MRGAILIVLVALLAVSTGVARAERDAARPVVRITQLSPLVVAGEGFRSRERIVIRVTAGVDTSVRRTRVSPRGAFVARFAAVVADRCSGGISVVVTTAGGRVAKTRMPELLCPPGIP